MFHLKLKVKYNTGYFTSQRPMLCEAKRRNAHLLVSLRANDVCPTGKKASSEEFKLPFAKNCLAALKNKKQGRPFRSAKQTLVFYFCAAIF
jgi:hypothetical protein